MYVGPHWNTMSRSTARIAVINGCKQPRTVVVEPWADQYTLSPDGSLTVVAWGDEGQSSVPWFGLVEWDNTTQVYCEETADFYVEQDGRRLQYGREVEVSVEGH